jgi:hypothetical protein
MHLQEELTIAHHGMEVRQVTSTIEVTHAALVEAPIIQVPQMRHITLDHVEMAVQKEVQIQLIIVQTAIHLADTTTHDQLEQVVLLKVVGQMAAGMEILLIQATQEVLLLNHLAGTIAEAVVQAHMVAVAVVARVVAQVVLVLEVAVVQDN